MYTYTGLQVWETEGYSLQTIIKYFCWIVQSALNVANCSPSVSSAFNMLIIQASLGRPLGGPDALRRPRMFDTRAVRRQIISNPLIKYIEDRI